MRNHDTKYQAFECGEGPGCNIDFGGILGAVAGPLIGGLLGGKEQSDVNAAQQQAAQQNAELARLRFPWIEPYAQQIAGEGQRLYGLGGFSPDPNALQLLGRKNYLGYAEDVLPGLVGATQGSWQQALDPRISPYIFDLIGQEQAKLQERFAEQTMPYITHNAQAAGGYGGSRQGVAEGAAVEGLLEAQSSLATDMLAKAYAAELGQQRAAWNQAGNMLGYGYLPSQAQQYIGGLYRSDAMNPAQNLAGYQNVIAPYTPPGPGITPFQPQTPPWIGAAGGALAGAGVGQTIGSGIGNAVSDLFGQGVLPSPTQNMVMGQPQGNELFGLALG